MLLLACPQTIREAAAKAAQNPLPGEAEVTALDTPGGPLGVEGADTQREFDEQAASAVARYVEDALQRHFGSLVSHVNAACGSQLAARDLSGILHLSMASAGACRQARRGMGKAMLSTGFPAICDCPGPAL